MRPRAAHSILLFALYILTPIAAAQDAPSDETLSPKHREELYEARQRELEPEFEARAKTIASELKDLDRNALPQDHWSAEWAGRYFVGDGLGFNVAIQLAPNGNVTYSWRGCLGLYDMNYGKVAEVLPDGLRLELAIDPDLNPRPFFDDRLYFVKWGKARFLIPECKMIDVVNNYNAGGYSRQGMYSSPRLDGMASLVAPSESIEGKPELPAEWAKLLLIEPFKITITSIEAQEPRKVTGDVWRHAFAATFDAGTNSGVYKGMDFTYNEGMDYASVTISSVEADTCTGEITFFDGEDPPEPPPVGYSFTLPAE